MRQLRSLVIPWQISPLLATSYGSSVLGMDSFIPPPPPPHTHTHHPCVCCMLYAQNLHTTYSVNLPEVWKWMNFLGLPYTHSYGQNKYSFHLQIVCPIAILLFLSICCPLVRLLPLFVRCLWSKKTLFLLGHYTAVCKNLANYMLLMSLCWANFGSCRLMTL